VTAAVDTATINTAAVDTGTVNMVAVVPVRQGALPLGAAEAVAESGGQGLVVGEGAAEAAAGLPGPARIRTLELGDYAPARWAVLLAPLVEGADVVVLPASPDGRDLAPRLSHALRWPLLAGASAIAVGRVEVGRYHGQVAEIHHPTGPVVATLLPGVRGVAPSSGTVTVVPLELPAALRAPTLFEAAGLPNPTETPTPDATVLDVSPPDPASMDLAEAPFVLAGGAGLGDPERFGVLARVAAGLGASPGATRVVADAGWVPAHRYIGTTGVTIAPKLYIALGISGAVQHVTGIGHPEHVISVNTDPSAPMMSLADLAIVTDARALLDELAARVGTPAPATAHDGHDGHDG
jgi:electron transfer flavoprotein alpha subunit